MGMKELFVVIESGGGGGGGGGEGDGKLSSPFPSLSGKRKGNDRKKKSQLLLIINSQCFREEGNGKESNMWDVEENRKKRRLPSSNAALERGTPRLLTAFASRAWFHNPELRTLCTLGQQTGPRNYDGIPVNPFNPKE